MKMKKMSNSNQLGETANKENSFTAKRAGDIKVRQKKKPTVKC